MIQPSFSSSPGGAAVFDTTLIERSAWFDGAADYMARQNGAAFANDQEAIFSFWVLRTKLDTQQAFFGSVEGGQGFQLKFENTNKLWIYQHTSYNQKTTAVYRDIGWYHILVSFDTSQATASDRVKLWVNGEQVTNFSTATYNPQNTKILGLTGLMTGAETMRIGNYNNTVSNYYFWNGYVAQACMLESVSIQQGDYAVSDFLDTYTFGVNGSQYVPKADATIAALATAAGGNSFCLTTAIGDGTDASGNGNNFTPTSMSDAANGTADTPSLNYCILSPLSKAAFTGTFSEGNLRLVVGSNDMQFGTMFPQTGKWFFEVYVTDANNSYIGIVPETNANGDASSYGWRNGALLNTNGDIYTPPGTTNDGSPSWGDGVRVGVAYDVDNRLVWWSIDGQWYSADDSSDAPIAITEVEAGNQGYDFSGLGGTGFAPCIAASDTGGNCTLNTGTPTASFIDPTSNSDGNGYGLFADPVPSGFLALNSANLPTPVYQGADYFTVTLAQEADIEADVASAVADWSSNVTLYKNLAVAESWIHRFSSDASNEYLTGDNASPTYQSTSTLAGTNAWVAFSFRTEDQAYQETGISHTNGAVTTVTHNLGNADAMILLYNRSGTGNIFIYAPQLTAGKLVKLNTHAPEAVDTSIQNVLANSFDIGSTQATGTYDVLILLNGDVFGVTSYTGSGAADGSFLSLPFKPQFMYLRHIYATNDGPFFDTTRDDTGNLTNDALFMNLNDVEYPDIGSYNQDFLSGGWKARRANVSFNASSVKYFVLAIADIAGGGDLPPIYGR